MNSYVLDFAQWGAVMQKETQAGTRLVAPVATACGVYFKTVSRLDEITLDFVTTKNGIKEYFFPASESILTYNAVTREPQDMGDLAFCPTLIWGAKPCDAASVSLLDAVFSWDYKDPFYLKRREATLIITQACVKKGNTCFCTSVGLSTVATQGSDILFFAQNTRYFLWAVTPKGDAWLQKHATPVKEIPQELLEKAEQNRPDPKFDLGKIKQWLDTGFEDKAFWMAMSDRCLGCAVCTYVCPTCHCFDIIDEGDACKGCRVKNWDSCSFGLFTKHTSGHNPRHTNYERWRQRIMHKFKYCQDNFKLTFCTGCGRCVDQCPVSMGVFETLCGINNK